MVIKRTHRVLYVDASQASREAVRLLNGANVKFAKVMLLHRVRDPRGFTKLPTFTYVTRSGLNVTKQGLGEIKASLNAIRSDFLAEAEERRDPGQRRSQWDPEQVEQIRGLMDAARG